MHALRVQIPQVFVKDQTVLPEAEEILRGYRGQEDGDQKTSRSKGAETVRKWKTLYESRKIQLDPDSLLQRRTWTEHYVPFP